MEHLNLFLNLKRAIEIAYHGNFKIAVFADKDYKNAKIDFETLKNFIGKEIFSPVGEIKIEIYKPKSYISKLKQEKIEKKPFNKMIKKEFPENSITFVNVATEKTDLSLMDILLIKDISQAIASFDECSKIDLMHVAEAIQYRSDFSELVNLTI